LAGLTEEVILNTKPLNRLEAARIVAQAVQRLRSDQYGDYNHRGYLEELLYELVEEFGLELREMGVKTFLRPASPMGTVMFRPVDHAQLGSDFADRAQRPLNDLGRKAGKGTNLQATLDGRMQMSDYLSVYYQPEVSWDEDNSGGKLASGYLKLTLFNTELEVGRESLWWGPGFRGSMSFSSNSRPLDQIKVSAAEPFRLPWPLSYLGSVKATGFVARLEDDRDRPNAKVGAWRLSAAPSSFLEVGFNRIFQFGGRGRSSIGPWDFIRLLVDDGVDKVTSPLNVNNVMSFDGILRLPDAGKYILLARDAALYFDFGWDDTLFGLFVPDKPGGIVGAYLTGVFSDPKLDFRVEYARTSSIMFTHNIYTSGFTYKGSLLSHFIGTQGEEIFVRTSRWLSPEVLIGLQVGRSEVGPPKAHSLSLPREKRDTLGIDLSYRVAKNSLLFLAYDLARVQDRNFTAGQSGNDNIFRVEYTHSFGR
jgi:hypothetical protein